MKHFYNLLIIGLLFLILGPNIFNLCPSVLCENDIVMDVPETQEKNNMYIAATLFAITTILYILYIKNGGNPPTDSSSLGDISEKIAPVLDTATKSPVVLQREVVVSVDIPPRSTFTNQYTLELGQKVYQQTKEIAALNTQITSLQDTIFGLENKIYISQAQVESYRSTISELQQRINFLVQQNMLFGDKTRLIVDYLMGLYDRYPILSREELNEYLRTNNLF